MSVRRTRDGSQHRFTLIEVVVSVAVLGLIIGPLSAATMLLISHGQSAASAFADDTSIRSVISVFGTDAESAEAVTAPDPTPCGSSTSALVTFTWTDGGTVFRASWSTQTSGAVVSLVRRRCTGTSLVSTLVIGDVQAAPAVSCSPNSATALTVTMTGTAANGATFSVTGTRRPS